MRLSSASAIFALAAASAFPQPFWNQSFDYAYFSDVAITRAAALPGGAAFALGTALNKPHIFQAFDATGAALFSVTDNRTGAAFTTASARHAESAPNGAVDLALISYYWDGSIQPDFGLACVVTGFASSSAAPATPVWTFSTNASLGCSPSSLAFSDDGSTVALAAMADDGTGTLVATLFVLHGQTGALAWSTSLDAGVAKQGGAVWLTARGSWLVHSHTAGSAGGYSVDVRSAADGSMRGSVAEGWNTPGMLSEDGVYLVVGGQDNCMFYNFTAGAYQPALPRFYPGDGTGERRPAFPRRCSRVAACRRLDPSSPLLSSPPPRATDWYVNDIAVTSDGSGAADAELVSLAWSRFDQRQARVTTLSMVTGAVLTDWLSPVNADQLGNGARLAMDGAFTGVALQGDNDDSPTAVVLAAGSSTPLLSFTSRGSMNSAALVVESAAASLVFAVAGKACNNNVACMGSDAFAWRLAAPNATRA